jgi:hypothetical protein
MPPGPFRCSHAVQRLRTAEAAALVILVWREPGVEGFRGRITSVVGTAWTGETVVAVDGRDLVQATVRQWLEDFLAASGPYSC